MLLRKFDNSFLCCVCHVFGVKVSGDCEVHGNHFDLIVSFYMFYSVYVCSCLLLET